jgi:hypothetical protein
MMRRRSLHGTDRAHHLPQSQSSWLSGSGFSRLAYLLAYDLSFAKTFLRSADALDTGIALVTPHVPAPGRLRLSRAGALAAMHHGHPTSFRDFESGSAPLHRYNAL